MSCEFLSPEFDASIDAIPRSPIAAGESPIVGASFVREDARGEFVEILRRGPWHTVVSGRMNAQAVLGNHYHAKTRMFFFLLHGSADVTWENSGRCELTTATVAPREGVYLEPGVAHAIRFREESSFVLLKSEPYDPGDPDTFPRCVVDPEKENAREPR